MIHLILSIEKDAAIIEGSLVGEVINNNTVRVLGKVQVIKASDNYLITDTDQLLDMNKVFKVSCYLCRKISYNEISEDDLVWAKYGGQYMGPFRVVSTNPMVSDQDDELILLDPCTPAGQLLVDMTEGRISKPVWYSYSVPDHIVNGVLSGLYKDGDHVDYMTISHVAEGQAKLLSNQDDNEVRSIG
jgi:hypothetical protein